MPQVHLLAELDHLSLLSPDARALAQFYCRALQLHELVGRAKEKFFCEGFERRVVIGSAEKPGLEFAAFRVDSPERLETLRQRLMAAGHGVEAPPASFFENAFAVRDPDGNRLVFGCASRGRAHVGMTARLQHFGIGTIDIDAAIEFYRDALGLRISDQIHADDGSLRTAFLRAGEEHHVIAIFLSPRNTFDHHCYEAGDWNLIRDWADHFASLDIPLDWGPGRHGPGNNLFMMIRDPDHNWLEISAELETVPDDKPIGKWEHSEKTGNSWGTAYLRS